MTPMNAHAMAQALGARGGRARAERLSADERRRIASLGGHARRRSILAARRIEENLRFAAAVLELQGGAPAIRRMKACSGPLPGIYPARI